MTQDQNDFLVAMGLAIFHLGIPFFCLFLIIAIGSCLMRFLISLCSLLMRYWP